MKHNLVCTIHPEGWIFVAIFSFTSFLLGLIAEPLGYIGAALTAWCIYFFRNPDRVVPTREGLIVSPADGIVTSIIQTLTPSELSMGSSICTRISIFLNVFNVHINRIPIGGRIIKSLYNPGKFFNASLDKASEHNERQTLVIETPEGRKIICVQIAGLIARRIRCDVRENDTVITGSRFGLIRFGSRLDVYIPIDVAPQVTLGQIMVAGETVLADFNSTEAQRQGELR